ncbi:MAG TPA: VCBS repeat-containing protein, partial [Kofleriaceae bacterium]|nr:VCBS repeat-containing protein [Kofleriaceae bacterium]
MGRRLCALALVVLGGCGRLRFDVLGHAGGDDVDAASAPGDGPAGDDAPPDGPSTVGTTIPAGNGPSGVAVGDFNQDGFEDIAECNDLGDNVVIFLGDGTGHFTQGGTFPVGISPGAIIVRDFNG